MIEQWDVDEIEAELARLKAAMASLEELGTVVVMRGKRGVIIEDVKSRLKSLKETVDLLNMSIVFLSLEDMAAQPPAAFLRFQQLEEEIARLGKEVEQQVQGC